MFKLKVDLLQGLVLKPTHSDSCVYLLKWSHTRTLETGSSQTTWKDALRDYRKIDMWNKILYSKDKLKDQTSELKVLAGEIMMASGLRHLEEQS